MRRTSLISIGIISALSLGMLTESANANGMFDWMSPGKWFNNNRDYDRDYYYPHNYGYPGGYGYPAWGGYGGYPGYPAWGYPAYNYPAPPPTQQSNPAPAQPPVPQ